jgi:cytidine deaminase
MVTEEQKEALIETARRVQALAYAPYSGYPVGAAILAEDGRIFSGVNVENAVYNLGTCAERAAVFAAVTAGVRKIEAVAVSTRNAGSPCGACRQVLSEFAGDVPVWLVDGEGHVREQTLGALLPFPFGPQHLV